MGLDPFATDFDIFSRHQYYSLNPSSTLIQNEIRDGDTLIAKMIVTKAVKPLPGHYINRMKLINKDEYEKYEPKTHAPSAGLIVDGVCVNEKCLQ